MLPFYLGLLANILLIPAMIIASPVGLTYMIWMLRKESRENVDRAKNRLKNLA
jgi:cbb3-type cytochrome oxidase subunit 3